MPGQLYLLFRNDLEKVIILSGSSWRVGHRQAGSPAPQGSVACLCHLPLHMVRAPGVPGVSEAGLGTCFGHMHTEGTCTPTLDSGDRWRLEDFLGNLDTREESFLIGPRLGSQTRNGSFPPYWSSGWKVCPAPSPMQKHAPRGQRPCSRSQ